MFVVVNFDFMLGGAIFFTALGSLGTLYFQHKKRNKTGE